MRTSPSIVPHDGHQDIYIVLDDFGTLGRAWRETDEAGTNRTALVRNLLDGQYENPVRIVAFNTTENVPACVLSPGRQEMRRQTGGPPDGASADARPAGRSPPIAVAPTK